MTPNLLSHSLHRFVFSSFCSLLFFFIYSLWFHFPLYIFCWSIICHLHVLILFFPPLPFFCDCPCLTSLHHPLNHTCIHTYTCTHAHTHSRSHFPGSASWSVLTWSWGQPPGVPQAVAHPSQLCSRLWLAEWAGGRREVGSLRPCSLVWEARCPAGAGAG